MTKELKAIKILEHYNQIVSVELAKEIAEAIEELEEYEQNFKQKEFDYRTKCQDIISEGRVEAEKMPDRFAELEKVVLYHYLGQGYQIGIGEWKFNVDVYSFYKSKRVRVTFWDYEKNIHRIEYNKEFKNTKEMFDKAIEYFSISQNEVVEKKQST